MQDPSPQNIDIYQEADLEGCQDCLGYRFSDEAILLTALTHASGASHRLLSNERLEFLGDAILGQVVCDRLFHLYPDYLEGELTKVKSVVVSRDNCADITESLGLDRYLILGKGMAADPEIPRSVLAAGFEAIVAAIYLDGGGEAAREFILCHIEDSIEQTVACEFSGNYKSQLQQMAQREHGQTPVYHLLDEQGPDHSKSFKIAASIGEKRFPAAWGRSKKESEQRAAHNAISDIRGEEAPYASDDDS